MINDIKFIVYTSDAKMIYSGKFSCGNSAIDSFFNSSQVLDDYFGKTYVMVLGKRIIGFYNISTGCIEDDMNIRIGGSIYINYLAVDENYQKMKYNDNWYISDLLLMDCINRIIKIKEGHLGFSFITLASTDEGYNLYKRNGFEDLEDDMFIAKNSGEKTCYPMYLPLDFEE